MMLLPAGTKVHLAVGHTDMRKGIDGLATMVQEVLKEDSFSGHLDAKRVARLLADRGMLKFDAAGKTSISTNLPGVGRARVYVVTPMIFATEDSP